MSTYSETAGTETRAAGRLRIGVAIATVGRPQILFRTVGLLSIQRRRADAVLVCSPGEEDVIGLTDAFPKVAWLRAARGLPHQRNRLLDASRDLDILLFLDDDFLMDIAYLEEIEAAFRDEPELVVATGRVVADGIVGPGFTFEEGLVKLAALPAQPDRRFTDVYNGYGCNMAVRLETVRAKALKFDEALPLYAWLEDVDFSRLMAPFGRIARVETAMGVHLGVKSGRQRGERLGYSQIANPCYLIGKGTCAWRKGLFLMSRNVAANLLGTIRREKTVDRPARLIGNLRALADLLTQRLAPSRALRL